MARWWAIGWRSPPLWVSHWLSPSVLRPESRQSFIWLPTLPTHTISFPFIHSSGRTCGFRAQNAITWQHRVMLFVNKEQQTVTTSGLVPSAFLIRFPYPLIPLFTFTSLLSYRLTTSPFYFLGYHRRLLLRQLPFTMFDTTNLKTRRIF